MPIKIPEQLPANSILEGENIFVMTERQAVTQDIRPLKLIILNLMPTKIVTETQLARCLSNTPLQIEIELLQMATHESKNTPEQHLFSFYQTFETIKNRRYDGMIITGAPVELLEFEEVDYWGELCEIMDWASKNVHSTLFLCWGAQAALYHYYGVRKYPLPSKMFGLFEHRPLERNLPLFRGFDDTFLAPHSRHTEVKAEEINSKEDLSVIASSDEAGVFIAANLNRRRIFVMGHPEYDAETLAIEYFRDADKGLDIALPAHYFPDDNPENKPELTWRAHANLLYTNWLNYYVYQATPYNLDELIPSK